MQRHDVDGLNFDFPDNWKVSKYDDWSFYRNQFVKMREGIKSLDLLAIDTANTAWMIEVKDYRVQQRTKPSDLAGEIAHKVFDTLAALLPAKIHANNLDEKTMAQHVLGAHDLRVVLHLEQPVKHSKLRPRAIDPMNLQIKIRGLLKPIDAHPKVVEMAAMASLVWQVS
jgi:hypothetical protein